MNTNSQADRDRLLELLADRALFGLDGESQSELIALQPMFPEIHDQEMDSIVALLGAAPPTSRSSVELPDSLRRQILTDAKSTTTNERSSIHAEPQVRVAEKPVTRWSRRLALVAWTAAATVLAVRGLEALQSSKTLTVAEQRGQILDTAADVVQVEWTDVAKTGTMSGDVVWSDAQQKGFMTFKGLPKNKPALSQYQLWIFENLEDEHPVDGGVFDIVGADVVVPIDAKIKVKNAKMFAVTIEKPGGVVVSDRKRLPLLAKVIN